MKRKICALLTALLLLGTASAASLPEGMAYLAACRIQGETTEGVTLVVTGTSYDGETLCINTLMLPNEAGAVLVDNQVETPPDDPEFLREKEEAAALGDPVLGVVCDLYSLTDTQGNDIWRNYSCSGRPVATEMPFDFKIPMADVQGPVQVELYFGVNEDLGSRFEQDARLILSVPLLAD